jgi:hypothetical protein
VCVCVCVCVCVYTHVWRESERIRGTWHAWERREKCTGFFFLVGKLEAERPLGRPRRRWEDGIKMDLTDIGWEGVEWIHLAQDRCRWWSLVTTVMNLRVLTPRS